VRNLSSLPIGGFKFFSGLAASVSEDDTEKWADGAEPLISTPMTITMIILLMAA
jgi:hypothetical protein